MSKKIQEKKETIKKWYSEKRREKRILFWKI